MGGGGEGRSRRGKEGRRRKGENQDCQDGRNQEKNFMVHNILNKKIANWCQGATEAGNELRVT